MRPAHRGRELPKADSSEAATEGETAEAISVSFKAPADYVSVFEKACKPLRKLADSLESLLPRGSTLPVSVARLKGERLIKVLLARATAIARENGVRAIVSPDDRLVACSADLGGINPGVKHSRRRNRCFSGTHLRSIVGSAARFIPRKSKQLRSTLHQRASRYRLSVGRLVRCCRLTASCQRSPVCTRQGRRARSRCLRR